MACNGSDRATQVGARLAAVRAHRERAALAGLAAHVDRPAVRLHDELDDAQPQPAAARLAREAAGPPGRTGRRSAAAPAGGCRCRCRSTSRHDRRRRRRTPAARCACSLAACTCRRCPAGSASTVTSASRSARTAGRPGATCTVEGCTRAAGSARRRRPPPRATTSAGETGANSNARLFRSMREKVRKLSISRLSRSFSRAIRSRYSRGLARVAAAALAAACRRRARIGGQRRLELVRDRRDEVVLEPREPRLAQQVAPAPPGRRARWRRRSAGWSRGRRPRAARPPGRRGPRPPGGAPGASRGAARRGAR